jgi:hypothetical protein
MVKITNSKEGKYEINEKDPSAYYGWYTDCAIKHHNNTIHIQALPKNKNNF